MLVALLALLTADLPTKVRAAPDVPHATAPEPADRGGAPVRPATMTYFTAGQLSEQCADPSPAKAAYCFAYIAAVHDTVRAYEQWLNLREFCAPRDASQSELRRAFMAYIAGHLGDQSGQAASVVVVAFKQRYPCPVLPPPVPAPSPRAR